jgi:phosphoglycolate phosphatase
LPTLKIDEKETTVDLVLFDLDGTLVDDRDRYRSLASARFRAVREATGKEAAVTWAKLMGVNPDTFEVDMAGPISKAPRREDMAIAAAALFQHGHSWYEAKELIQRAYEEADNVQAQSYTPKLFPGVYDALKNLAGVGFRLGIATNGETRITSGVLRDLKIDRFFDVVVGADMVVEGKPAPDLILEACNLLDVEPGTAAYVGDQPVDAQAGCSAGLALVIGVGDPGLKDSGADVVLRSVAELT